MEPARTSQSEQRPSLEARDQPSKPDAPGKLSLLVNRNFALLWSGQAISQIGDWVFDTTLVLWIGVVLGRGQSWAPLAVSGVLAAASLPFFLVGPLAGVFVDRWDKRRTMLAMDGARAALVALLAILTLLRLPLGWMLTATYLTVFLASLCSQFFRPSLVALIGEIVEEPQRVRASSLSETTTTLAFIIGPVFAAPLLYAFGPQLALLIDALSFVVSFAAVRLIERPATAAEEPGHAPNVWGELATGLRFYFGDRVLTTMLISFVIVGLGAGAFNALALFFVTDNLHASGALYGVAVAAVGAGSLAGAVVGGLAAPRIGLVRMFWLSLLALGVSVVVLSRLSSIGPGLVCYVVFGFTQGPINVALIPLLLRVTPSELVGRVVAVLDPATMLASVGSMVLAGLLVSTILRTFSARVLFLQLGPVDTIYLVMGLLTLLAGGYAMVQLRGVEDAPTPRGEGAAADASVSSVETPADI